MTRPCANCGEALAGAYCHACGQKVIGEADRRLGHLLGQFLAAATDLDGRFWRSLRVLVARPGQLSRDYLDGRRRHWMGPVSLFVLANVLYFLSPGTVSDFNLSLAEQRQQVHSYVTNDWIEARVAERDAAAKQRWESLPEDRRAGQPAGYTLADYSRDYAAQAGNVGKALLILHVPFLALALALLFFRRRMYLAEHAVVATHQFTFLLLLIQCVLVPAEWAFTAAGQRENLLLNWIVITGFVWILVHLALSVRRVYAPPAWVWIPSPFVLVFVMMLGNVFVYRPLQFLLTWAIT